MNALTARLEALAAGPKPWVVTTTYTSGHVRTLRCPNEGGARNHADRESRKIGRQLIDRDTGATVCVASVTVDYLPETI